MEPQRFENLGAAGRALAPKLLAYQNQPDVIVLAIASAGIPVAREVADFLNAPMDMILIRRLLVGEELGSHLCAVNVAGQTVLDQGITPVEQPSTPLEVFLGESLAGLAARAQICRRGHSALEVADRTVIVVDCGVRTGSTMKAAARAVRQTRAGKLVGAVPIASREGQAEVAPLFDEFVCLAIPEQFVNAGYWYADFSRPSDEETAAQLA